MSYNSFENTLTPAYGRDYTALSAVQADVKAEKDFQVQPQGCYTTAHELRAMGYTHAFVRYSKLTKIGRVTL